MRYVLAGLRLALGWYSSGHFLTRLSGLGHETPTARAWINGGSPTDGFLGHGVAGPFADFYRSLVGSAWADWLFMGGWRVSAWR